jgi:hypothetical protein
MGEITPKTAKFYIYPNFYPLRIKYFEKKQQKPVARKISKPQSLNIKRGCAILEL